MNAERPPLRLPLGSDTLAGIERKMLANSAAYLKSWSDVLKTDSRMVISAASQAQKAADYVLGNGA